MYNANAVIPLLLYSRNPVFMNKKNYCRYVKHPTPTLIFTVFIMFIYFFHLTEPERGFVLFWFGFSFVVFFVCLVFFFFLMCKKARILHFELCNHQYLIL